jgi:hypothetical protein
MSSRLMKIVLFCGLLMTLAAASSSDDSNPKPAAAGGDSSGVAVTAPAADTTAHHFIAYYFHTTKRCPSCIKIEAYTKEAIDSGFGENLKAGSLEWQVVNTDEPENEHFLKDYQLFTKSVVLVDMQSDRQVKWTNLAKVWELLGDKEEFVKYIQSELTSFMKAD